VRIISGKFRGRKLLSFEGDSVRPTTDRVKESMFNLIQEFVPGSRVLDLFGGSGALSLEAISRGAESAVCVDIDPKSIEIIRKNIALVHQEETIRVLNQSAEHFLENTPGQFHLVFLDPPYNRGFIRPIMDKLVEKNLLYPEGIIVLESDFSDEHGEIAGLTILRQKRYGRSYVTVYQRN